MKTAIQTGNRDMIRAINRGIILNKIKTEGEISRAQIARDTNLSPATVTSIANELIDEGLVYEKEAGVSSGGRRPMMLSLVPTGGYVIGIKVRKDSLSLVLADFKATILYQKAVILDGDTPLHIAGVIEKSVNQILKEHRIERRKLLGIGIGMAGRIDFSKGIVLSTPLFDWPKTHLRELVSEKINLPVYLDNDVNTLTLAEQHFGEGEGVSNFITVSIGRGLGMGLVMNGSLCRGKDSAGELGHIMVDAGGEKCQCGKIGCLETMVSIPALLKKINAQKGTRLQSLSDLSESEQNDPVVNQILIEAGKILGIQISNLTILLGPERIIFSGEGVQLPALFFQSTRKAFGSQLMDFENKPEIVLQEWEDENWARGAAYLVFDALFNSPQFHRVR